MQDIKIREEKIQEKRKFTLWREFLKEISSWYSICFYKNDGIISVYPDVQRFAGILSIKEFEKYIDMINNHGLDYDPKIDFFKHFKILFKSIKLPAVRVGINSENSNYSNNVVGGSKNAYLSHNVVGSCENVLYSVVVKEHSTNILNSVMVIDGSENVYLSAGVINGFNIFYSRYINNCSNIRFSDNLIGCQECISCHDLENQSYCIANQKYEKEQYFAKKDELLEQKGSFFRKYIESNLNGKNIGSKKVKGSFILNSHNIENGFYIYQIENGQNLIFVGGNQASKNNFDCFNVGSPSYDFCGVLSSYGDNIYCSHTISGSKIYYSYNCIGCSYCIGCIGLKNKSFCILNKQYTKEERYELANKIFAQMDKDGTLGQFFPGSMNPFYFNDTAAYLIDDSFTKEEVTAEGYLRRDEEIKVDIPVGSEVVYSYQIEGQKSIYDFQGFDSEGNWKIDPEILKKVIVDEKGNSYRIIKMEYDFLMKYGLPLPEIHRLDRIKLGFKFK